MLADFPGFDIGDEPSVLLRRNISMGRCTRMDNSGNAQEKVIPSLMAVVVVTDRLPLPLYPCGGVG